jgi:hypothetical protein
MEVERRPCRYCQDDCAIWCEGRGFVCLGCYAELKYGTLPPLEEITSPHVPHVPKGMSIRRLGRHSFSTNEDVDFYGKHDEGEPDP